MNTRDDDTTSTASDTKSSDDSSYSEQSVSDSTPILKISEILSQSPASEYDSESESTSSQDSMPPLVDRNRDEYSSTDNDSRSDDSSQYDSISDESSVDTPQSNEHNYDPNNSGAQFRHMVMTTNSTRCLDPFKKSNDTHEAKSVSIHTALASKSKCHKHQEDHSESILGSPSCTLNWLCDTGATAHMTPRLDDLRNIENVDSVNVEVADGFNVPVNAIGECQLHLEDQNGLPFTVIMNKV